MEKEQSLGSLSPGETARIRAIKSESSLRRRLLDIGLVENTEVECIGKSPCGDPYAFLIRGAVIAIRKDDCSDILIYS